MLYTPCGKLKAAKDQRFSGKAGFRVFSTSGWWLVVSG
jgi:hypothetical protein